MEESILDFLTLDFEHILFEDDYVTTDELIKKCIRVLSKRPVSLSNGKTFKKDILTYLATAKNMILGQDYDLAMATCTKGLQLSIPFSVFSADFYNIRSRALERLELYRESLSDIERAIDIGVASEASDDLRKRKTKLETKLAACKPAAENLNETRKKYYNEVPPLSAEDNKIIPGASDAIRVAYDRVHGPHFVATQFIKTGDVILTEKPYATYIVPDRDALNDAICHYCHQVTKAPIPCDNCSVALYCSKECLNAANAKYKNIECRFIAAAQEMRPTIQLLLAITENGVKLEEAKKYCVEMDEMDDDARSEVGTSEEVLTNDMKWILNLSLSMKKNWAKESGKVGKLTSLALMLRNFSTYTQGNNDMFGLTKLLLRVHYIADFYIRSISTPDFDEVRTGGFYPFHSIVLHSCYSNTIYSTHKDDVLVMRATRNIKPGEKITYNTLGENLLHLSPDVRKHLLLKLNHAECQCTVCAGFYTFKPELRKKLDVPVRLQRQLRKNTFDVPAMWELLKLINNEIERPCFEAEAMKVIIQKGYASKESELMWVLYNALGVF